MSTDDALMARFFASYVSPSERPSPPVRAYDADAKVDCKHCGSVTPLHRDWCMACGRNHLVAPALPSAEPVLPAGWRWLDEDRAYYGRAAGPHYCIVHWNREESQLIYLGCEAGEFPEVERYVLWKNGVAQ